VALHRSRGKLHFPGDYFCRMTTGNKRYYVAFALSKNNAVGAQIHVVASVTNHVGIMRPGKTLTLGHRSQVTLAVPSTPLIVFLAHT